MLTKQKIEEIDSCAKRFIELRNLSSISKENENIFLSYRENFFKNLKSFVDVYTSKYKKFSNYQDLSQEGFTAAIQALETYKINKGSLSFWFKRYIETRVKRQAGAHSAIRIPLKKSKINKPIKTDEIPEQIDIVTPEDIVEKKNLLNRVYSYRNKLSKMDKDIFDHHFKLEDTFSSVEELCKNWKINKKYYKEIINNCINEIRK